jgi:hypothetical protein
LVEGERLAGRNKLLGHRRKSRKLLEKSAGLGWAGVGHIGQVASGLARLKQTADENEFGRFQEKKMKMKNGDGLGLPGKSGRN